MDGDEIGLGHGLRRLERDAFDRPLHERVRDPAGLARRVEGVLGHDVGVAVVHGDFDRLMSHKRVHWQSAASKYTSKVTVPIAPASLKKSSTIVRRVTVSGILLRSSQFTWAAICCPAAGFAPWP